MKPTGPTRYAKPVLTTIGTLREITRTGTSGGTDGITVIGCGAEGPTCRS